MRISKVKFLNDKEVYHKLEAGEYNDIIVSFLPLAISIATKLKKDEYDLQEIISIGCLGLSKGVHKVNYKNMDIKYYLSKCICNEIYRFYISESKNNVLYYDDVIDDSETSFINLIEADTKVEDSILEEELKGVVLDALDCLSENNKYIIEKRYGINCNRMTQSELAAQLNIKRSTLAMKEKRILGELKRFISRNYKDYVI